ncbi:MAG: serine/threonine protein kinase [Phycisphaerales bacterium]|nr:MAG: serine/threonine protein kinase [Phycisphaerales bacterium]
MAKTRQERLEALFSAAVELDSRGARKAFLDTACGDDAELRGQVEELLTAHGKVGTFLDTPPVDPESTTEVRVPDEVSGEKIGRYRILETIGEGGFGIVYMAEQEEPVRRKVALKVIKLGMDTKQVIARFEAERQALALMDHPSIARVIDAGATDRGRPYFVMELVKGSTITEYCNQNKLTVRERLELFLSVCQAVQHAHQKGIIHRDLKPNNVLVTLQDNTPIPKVIDFGIAKATSQRLTERTLFTGFREFMGTPEYMSPDQAGVSGIDVDTRTDIYSLGVLLYELLTGTTPFEVKKLREASYEEIRRTIQEVDPPKPSARLSALENLAEIAGLRRVEPAALLRLIRGDLDWIVMKAIEKDRTHRYATVKDFADDIGRHLENQPVAAGPPGVGYRLRKFVRRNRVGVLAGSIAVGALLIGISLATAGFVKAIRTQVALEIQRDAAEKARASAQEQRGLAELRALEAQKQADRSTTVSRFLQGMLESVDPSKALGREVSVRYALDEAAKRIEEGALTEQPEVEADIRMTLGETYEALGSYNPAETHLRAAKELWSRLLGDEHPDTLRSSRALAGLLRIKGKFTEAEALLRQTAESQRRVLGDEHRDTLITMNELALALRGPGRLAEAETIHRRTLQIQRRVFGEKHVDTLESMCHLGAVCRAQGKYAEAEILLQRALELSRSALGETHPQTGEVMNDLGLLLEDQQDYAQAETLYRRTYELDRRILGPDHPRTLIPMNNLLRMLRIQEKTDAIRPLLVERIAHLRRVAESRDAGALALHAYAWELLNCELVDLRKPYSALSAAQRAVELDGGTDSRFLETLAVACQMTGDLDRAIETQRQAVAQARVRRSYDLAGLEERLVDFLMEKGDLVGAAAVSWEGLATRVGESLVPGSSPGAATVLQSETLMAEGRFGEAAALLRGCLAMRQQALPQGHWLISDVMSRLGGAMTAGGKFAEAEPLLLAGYEGLNEKPWVAADHKRRATERIVRLYESWGKLEQASKWRQVQRKAAESGASKD